MDKYVSKELIELSVEMQHLGWRVGSKKNQIKDLKNLRKQMANQLQILDNLIKIEKLSSK